MNSLGRIFRVSIFGESHGPCIGMVIDGVPPGIEFSEADMLQDLARRKPSLPGTTARHEADAPRILSGVYHGRTTGAPLACVIENSDARGADYSKLAEHPRPSHGDFASRIKYRASNDTRGGGHLSGRLTAPLVAAGALAKKIITPAFIRAVILDEESVRRRAEEAALARDSVGAILEVRVGEMPAGLGEPWFDSVESLLAHALFSVPGIKGIEFGAGFAAAAMTGSKYNDKLLDKSGKTASNNDGGITGGISNGNELVFRVAAKPTPSIGLEQETYSFGEGKVTPLVIQGRHDACFALRLPPVLEAVSAIVLADLALFEKTL